MPNPLNNVKSKETTRFVLFDYALEAGSVADLLQKMRSGEKEVIIPLPYEDIAQLLPLILAQPCPPKLKMSLEDENGITPADIALLGPPLKKAKLVFFGGSIVYGRNVSPDGTQEPYSIKIRL